MKNGYFIFMKLFFFLYLLIVLSVDASLDDNTSLSTEYSYVDDYHNYFDGKIHEWGVSIDGMILSIYDYFGEDENATHLKENSTIVMSETNRSAVLSPADGSLSQEEPAQKNRGVEKLPEAEKEAVLQSKEIDEFFLTRKLLEERDRSYVRVSFLQRYNSLEEDTSEVTVRARLGLGRSKKRLRLFIEDFNDDSAKNIGATGKDNSPAIGVDIFSREKFGIKPKYSIGFRGIDPFVRARYRYEKKFEKWRFEPVQTLTYSLRDEFSEITELYFDIPTSEHTFLRFLFDRGTQSGVNGMHYDGFVQWFWNPRKNRGLSSTLGFNGSTHYQNTLLTPAGPAIAEENRIFNNFFTLGWRENIFKPWLFYEVGPGVNYHETHDYRPNYNIYFKIDLFFGHV
jgi:hypothetical protein